VPPCENISLTFLSKFFIFILSMNKYHSLLLISFILFLGGCSTGGTFQNAKTVGKGEEIGNLVVEVNRFSSYSMENLQDREIGGWLWFDIRRGVGESTDIGIKLAPFLIFGSELYVKQELTPKNSPISLGGILGVYTIPIERDSYFPVPEINLIASGFGKRSPFYCGWKCSYRSYWRFVGLDLVRFDSETPSIDGTPPYLAQAVFLGWYQLDCFNRRNINAEFAVEYFKNHIMEYRFFVSFALGQIP
jgi:hypothetical protein